jgi:hypothetical protein
MEPTPIVPGPNRSLPDAGMLTFLFTDVEGSTPLWELHEATMRRVATRHDVLYHHRAWWPAGEGAG